MLPAADLIRVKKGDDIFTIGITVCWLRTVSLSTITHNKGINYVSI